MWRPFLIDLRDAWTISSFCPSDLTSRSTGGRSMVRDDALVSQTALEIDAIESADDALETVSHDARG